jgi:uncharacterized protein (TIGR02145 family)
MKIKVFIISLVLFVISVVSLYSQTVKDIDGNVYKTVTIGDQLWMAENLRTTKYNDGKDIPLITDPSIWSNVSDSTPAYCWYNNDKSTFKIPYGALYNWFTVETDKLCPLGWHVPTDEEWKQLEMYLGMGQYEANKDGFRGTNEGSKLKEIDTTHWYSPNSWATNENGFTALPGGYRVSSGEFMLIRSYCHFWTAAEHNIDYAWSRILTYYLTNIIRIGGGKKNGASVRCIKDE